jgi:hypothetical protein
MMKKRPETDWDVIEQEKVNLNQGYRNMPETEFELMEQSEQEKRNGTHGKPEK